MMVKQLRDAGHHEHIEDAIEDGALAATPEDLAELQTAGGRTDLFGVKLDHLPRRPDAPTPPHDAE
jgi:hypothetical protein